MSTIRYRDHNIDPAYVGWQFTHIDYDGPEDRRSGHGDSIRDCKEQIDEQLAERLQRDLTWEPPKRPARTYDIATVLAMVEYPLTPGDWDLDDVQPMAILVRGESCTVPLGDIREAQRLASTRTIRPNVVGEVA